jgi:hypothetical protein
MHLSNLHVSSINLNYVLKKRYYAGTKLLGNHPPTTDVYITI